MRVRYFSVTATEVYRPDAKACCRSSIVISSSSKSVLKFVAAAAVPGAGSRARAAPNAGLAAVARVAVIPLRRKLRRERYFGGRESVDIEAPEARVKSIGNAERESYEAPRRMANRTFLKRARALSCLERNGSLRKL